MTKRRRQATAYHEAGHAIMHCLLNVPFRKATIVAGDDYLGRVTGYRIGRQLREALEFGALTLGQRSRWERQIQVLLAGEIAERAFTGRRNRAGSESDTASVFKILFSICGSTRQVETCFAWLKALTSDAIESVSGQKWVELVANALVAQQTLSYAEVLAIYRSFPPPLSDEQVALIVARNGPQIQEKPKWQ